MYPPGLPFIGKPMTLSGAKPSSFRSIPKISIEMRLTTREEYLEWMLHNGNKEDLKNCTIITGDGNNTKTFVLSRQLLKASSFYIPNKILDQPSRAYNIHYLNINPDIFTTLLKHISLHTEWKFDGSVSEAKLLLETACKFKLEDFIQHIYSELVPKHSLEGMGFLTARTACQIYEATRAVKGAEDFKAAAFEFICRNALTIFKEDSFTKLSTEAVSEILTRDDIAVESELDVFEAVLSWHHAEKEVYLANSCSYAKKHNLRKCLKEKILDCVRFPNFQPYAYFSLIQRWKLLTTEEEQYLFSIWTNNFKGVDGTNDELKNRGFLQQGPRKYVKRPSTSTLAFPLTPTQLKPPRKVLKIVRKAEVNSRVPNPKESSSQTVNQQIDVLTNFLSETRLVLGDIRKELQEMKQLRQQKQQRPAVGVEETNGNPRLTIEGWGSFGNDAIFQWPRAE